MLNEKWETDRVILDDALIIPGKVTKWRETITPVEDILHFIGEALVNNWNCEKKAYSINKCAQKKQAVDYIPIGKQSDITYPRN